MLMPTRMGLPVALETACASYQLRCHSMRRGLAQVLGGQRARWPRGWAAAGAAPGAGHVLRAGPHDGDEQREQRGEAGAEGRHRVRIEQTSSRT